jgi:uncharacterized phage-associated protein
MRLQKLVYIAHGWCLAITGEPLTGDRPEAWDFGPMYRRLADALETCGQCAVTGTLPVEWSIEATGSEIDETSIWSELNTIERNVLTSVLLNYGAYSSSQLSVITRGEGAPWTGVYRRGEGRFREISHSMIRDQFVRFAQQVIDNSNHD